MARSTVVSRIITASALLALVAISAAGCSDGPTEPTTTDIDWVATARQFRGQNNTQLRFNCPPNGTVRGIWGIDVYTDDSSICTAAVHAGAITRVGGGQVTIEIRPGQAVYGGSTRNGITSLSYEAWDGSFVVR